MNQPFSRRGRIRALTYIAAAFVVLCGIAISITAQKLRYERMVTLSYARAFSQLTESMNKIDSSLEKTIYVTSPAMISSLCTEICAEATTARQAIGGLPYADLELEQTAAFTAKVGDYARVLARSAAQNGGYSGSELETVKALSKAASTLSQQLEELEAQLNDGTLTLDSTDAVEDRLSALTEDGDLLAGSSYESVEAEFPELPTLIYDGPFSEHQQNQESALLQEAKQLTAAQARRAAAEFLGVDPSALPAGQEVNGEVPCYTFSVTDGDGNVQRSVEITKQGGYVLSYSSSRTIGAASISPEEGVRLGKEFLEKRGITNMKESYYTVQSNSLTINFASVQEDVLCYPDLTKVEVALDNGEIVGYETAGYLANHHDRTGLQPWVSAEEAQESVSKELSILSHQLTIIPTDGGNEMLCWEFKCENAEGKHYLVYLNARTGAEQKLLILLEDEHGTLTI